MNQNDFDIENGILTICHELFDIEEILSEYFEYYVYFSSDDKDGAVSLLVNDITDLLLNGNFMNLKRMPAGLKYECIFRVLKQKSANRNFIRMIQEHLPEIFAELTETSNTDNKPEIVKGMLVMGAFTKENIDKYIMLANRKHEYEIQVMLTNYKAEHISYEENNLYL